MGVVEIGHDVAAVYAQQKMGIAGCQPADIAAVSPVFLRSFDSLEQRAEQIRQRVERRQQQEGFQQTTQENDIVVCVGRKGSKLAGKYLVWTGKIYRAQRRKSDGLLIWVLDSFFGRDASGYQPSAKLRQEVREAAENRGYRYSREQITQYQRCD
ncbi:MAG: hypothetical protein ACK5XN_09745 [Bacteroidota bacterium]|jgi:hypothetical protein